MTENRFDSGPGWDEEIIEDWTKDRLRKRSEELQLIDEHGRCISPNIETTRRSINRNRMENDSSGNDNDDGASKSASTTSDSQVNTIRYLVVISNNRFQIEFGLQFTDYRAIQSSEQHTNLP